MMATSVRLAPETEKRLDVLAKKTGRTKAFYLRQLIEDGLDEVEESYLALEVLERIRSGKEKTYSATQVRKRLGLED